MTIAGVDGYAGQWVMVSESEERKACIRLVSSIEKIFEQDDLSHVVIDVPIGLPEKESRKCDVRARRELGKRRSSVFPSPVRGVLDAKSYDELCERWVAIDGRRASKQLFAILPLIRAVDESMTPERQDRLREGHPELSFARMKGKPLHHSKKTAAGVIERLGLLQGHFPDVVDRLSDMENPGAAGDAIDAYALLWTARRWRNGRAEVLPENPPEDERGLRMEMIC